jgi:hypothetical protein
MQIILQPPGHTILLKIIQTNPILPLLLPPYLLDQEIRQHDLARGQLSLSAHRFLLFATGGAALDTRPAGFHRGGEVVDDADLVRVIAELGDGEGFAAGLGGGRESGLAQEDADGVRVAAECPAEESLVEELCGMMGERGTNRS